MQVCGSRGQAQVRRTHLKMVRRKKGELLTYLAQKIRQLMVMAFPGPAERTTDIVARDVSIEALENSEQVIQIQEQRLADLDAAVQLAQRRQ